MKLKVNDCLKYWRVIRYFIKQKYGLTTGDLDMLLFLYSEDIFSKEKFEEFDNLLSWDEDRFDRLLRDGWIEVFRRRRKKNSRHCMASRLKLKELLTVSIRSLVGRNTYRHEQQPYLCKECKVFRQGLQEDDYRDERFYKTTTTSFS